MRLPEVGHSVPYTPGLFAFISSAHSNGTCGLFNLSSDCFFVLFFNSVFSSVRNTVIPRDTIQVVRVILFFVDVDNKVLVLTGPAVIITEHEPARFLLF